MLSLMQKGWNAQVTADKLIKWVSVLETCDLQHIDNVKKKKLSVGFNKVTLADQIE